VISHGYGGAWDTWSLCGCCEGQLVKWSICVEGCGRRWLSLGGEGGGGRACICALLCWMHGKLMDNGMCGLCLS
jgi:hypothetical protein